LYQIEHNDYLKRYILNLMDTVARTDM
jgi:hypothetical protein